MPETIIYLAGITYNSLFGTPDQIDSIIETHLVSTNKIFEEILYGCELHIEKNQIIRAVDYIEGFPEDKHHEIIEINYPQNFPNGHSVKFLEFDNAGNKKLFGKPEDCFTAPKSGNQSKTLYLGNIDHGFNSIVSIPLIVAEHLTDILFIDYKDLHKPVFLNPNAILDYTSYDSIGEPIVSFDLIPYKIVDTTDNYDIIIGNTGVPLWIQHPQTPRSPVTGKTMKFLTGIDNCNGYFPNDFNVNSALYFFYEFESGIMAVVSQNT